MEFTKLEIDTEKERADLKFEIGLPLESGDYKDRTLRIKMHGDTTAYWYIDDELLGGIDQEWMWEFKEALIKMLNILE